MWPKLSNIHTGSLETIREYSTADKASKLSSWIRVFSGAKKGNLEGLILQSNTDTKLVRATGETTATLYGDSQSSGIIGLDWTGKVIESNSTRALRPSPIITGFSSKEGQDQISREVTLQLKAFTLEQMEEIQTYFLEPGYSLFIEWGWNTENGYRGFTTTNNMNTSATELVKSIAKKSLNFPDVIKQREKTKGQYDSFLGFIVGGNVQSSGDTFDIEVRLKGAPSIPSYLQGYRNSKQITPTGTVEVISDRVESLYSVSELEDTNTENFLAKRRFRYMFNELPSEKQLKSIQKLESLVTANQFINFDKVVETKIIDEASGTFILNSSTTDESKTEGLELKKEDLFSKNKYIRMDLVVDILNILGERDRFVIGDKRVSFKINIENTIIGGFPFMFSTKASKLIVPGKIPDFIQYFLEGDSVKTYGNGVIEKDVLYEPDIFDSGLTPFLGQSDLQGEYAEKAGYYGYLKYLFLNFDVFKTALNQKIINSREVLISILNEMSSAVNAFWKFQVVEGKFEKTTLSVEELFKRGQIEEAYKLLDSGYEDDGDVELTVIDENFVGELTEDIKNKITSFKHAGIGSVFLSSNLDISLPASMVGQIVSNRLGSSVNPDAPIFKTGETTFFESDTDLFVTNKPTPPEEGDTKTKKEQTELEKVEAELQNYYIAKTFSGGTQQIRNKITGEVVARVERNLVGSDKIRAENTADGKNYQNLRERQRELTKKEAEQRKSNLQAYLDKLDVVPLNTNLGIPNQVVPPNIGFGGLGALAVNSFVNLELTTENLTNDEFMKKRFAIHCFDDSDFFDLIKQTQIRGKYPDTTLPNGLSTLIPIKYTFSILGNSGIKRGDVFRISGIPSKYSERGIFQVTEIEHTLEQGKWVTQVGGLFRQIQ